ncbi:MAG: PAS domain-containing protein [Proteobacteria bacterium]|nr:PAS domain-containing protein [Pseudomonadota bacterium]
MTRSSPGLPIADPVAHERERWRVPPGDEPAIDAAARAVLAGAAVPFGSVFRDVGVPEPVVALDPARETLPGATLRFLHAYWSDLPRTGEMPAARAVDPVEMRPALGQIMLLDVEPSGCEFVYRVYGTKVADAASQDWTGWTTGALHAKSDSTYGPYFRAVYRACLLLRRPVFTEHHSQPFMRVKMWRRLSLPLAGTDGAVARILVGNVPCDPLGPDREAELALRERLGPES